MKENERNRKRAARLEHQRHSINQTMHQTKFSDFTAGIRQLDGSNHLRRADLCRCMNSMAKKESDELTSFSTFYQFQCAKLGP